MDYYRKYLKYKSKYVKMRSQSAGTVHAGTSGTTKTTGHQTPASTVQEIIVRPAPPKDTTLSGNKVLDHGCSSPGCDCLTFTKMKTLDKCGEAAKVKDAESAIAYVKDENKSCGYTQIICKCGHNLGEHYEKGVPDKITHAVNGGITYEESILNQIKDTNTGANTKKYFATLATKQKK